MLPHAMINFICRRYQISEKFSQQNFSSFPSYFALYCSNLHVTNIHSTMQGKVIDQKTEAPFCHSDLDKPVFCSHIVPCMSTPQRIM